LEKLREITVNLTEDGFYPSQDLNWTLSKYKPGVLHYINLLGDGKGRAGVDDDDESWVLYSCNYTFEKSVTHSSPYVLLKQHMN
jgi:hypothetical protein